MLRITPWYSGLRNAFQPHWPISHDMGALTDDMKRVVEQQRLGFVATVCADGTPNLSPKGTLCVLDDEHLMFADIRSPGTVANLRGNPSVEVNVVDPFLRKGYRFKGRAKVLEAGADFERLVAVFASPSSSRDLLELT